MQRQHWEAWIFGVLVFFISAGINGTQRKRGYGSMYRVLDSCACVAGAYEPMYYTIVCLLTTNTKVSRRQVQPHLHVSGLRLVTFLRVTSSAFPFFPPHVRGTEFVAFDRLRIDCIRHKHSSLCCSASPGLLFLKKHRAMAAEPITSSSELQADKSASATTNTSTMPPSPSLTLILAATPSLGIGKGGGLPWPQLKKEMGYFARVTKRVASPPSQSGARRINAVLMGRKTWDSIPPKFRPLKDRLNIVVTRNPEQLRAQLIGKADDAAPEGPLVASGIVDALAQLQDSSALSASSSVEVDRVFVIGGASIYSAALELPQTERVLLTKIKEEFECDTFFPVKLEDSPSWTQASRDSLEDFVGEQVVEGGVEEQGVKFEFCLFERRMQKGTDDAHQ